jgi:hypothetical protein
VKFLSSSKQTNKKKKDVIGVFCLSFFWIQILSLECSYFKLGLVVHACNTSTWEAKAEGSSVQG